MQVFFTSVIGHMPAIKVKGLALSVVLCGTKAFSFMYRSLADSFRTVLGGRFQVCRVAV